MKCPRDQSLLKLENHFHLNCSKCHGDFLLFPDQYPLFREKFHQVRRPKSLKCPSCEKKMVNLKHNHGSLFIETCDSCQGIWLDDNELNKLKKMIKSLHRQSRWMRGSGSKEVVTQEKIIYEKYLQHMNYTKEMTLDKAFFQIVMNIPIEHNIPPFKFPLVTWTIIIINIVALIKSYQLTGHAFFKEFAFYPTDPSIKTRVTSMFSHASVSHLLGNMYFLKILGDNVEDLMGHSKFIFFYLFSGIISIMPYFMRGGDIPLVGASGAVSGIMGSYFLLFPHVKFNLRFFFIFHFNFSCFALGIFWILMQLSIGYFGAANGRLIAWDSHLAGFATGLFLTYLFKKSHLT